MSSPTIPDDFDDDDVFDNVDVDVLLQSNQAPGQTQGATQGEQPRRQPEADAQLDDSLFDDVDAENLIASSQPPVHSPLKRSLDDTSDVDGGNNQRESFGTDHSSSSNKRRKTDHESTLWKDTEEDKANLKLACELLKKKFGYKSFRHEQEGAIRRVLAGENALVIFPTGAGKSLCYQVGC